MTSQLIEAFQALVSKSSLENRSVCCYGNTELMIQSNQLSFGSSAEIPTKCGMFTISSSHFLSSPSFPIFLLLIFKRLHAKIHPMRIRLLTYITKWPMLSYNSISLQDQLMKKKTCRAKNIFKRHLLILGVGWFSFILSPFHLFFSFSSKYTIFILVVLGHHYN